MNISVCIIVKNEQNNIEHCLKCLTPYMPEIIVVDTEAQQTIQRRLHPNIQIEYMIFHG